MWRENRMEGSGGRPGPQLFCKPQHCRGRQIFQKNRAELIKPGTNREKYNAVKELWADDKAYEIIQPT